MTIAGRPVHGHVHDLGSGADRGGRVLQVECGQQGTGALGVALGEVLDQQPVLVGEIEIDHSLVEFDGGGDVEVALHVMTLGGS